MQLNETVSRRLSELLSEWNMTQYQLFSLDIFYPSDSSQPKSDKIFTAVSLALALDTS